MWWEHWRSLRATFRSTILYYNCSHQSLYFLTLYLLFSCSVMSNSLQPHELQHTRLSSPSLSAGVCSHSCPLSQWCHPTISSFVVSFSPSPPACSLSQHQGLFQWVGSSHQVAKILELQLQHQFFQWIFRVDLFHLGLTSLISLLSKGLLYQHSLKASIFWCSGFFDLYLISLSP